MSKAVRIVIVAAFAVAVIGTLAFFYLTRPLAAPTEDVQTNAQVLEVSADTADESAVFRISQDESEAQFQIDEVLNGQDKTVVGTTDQVAGDILINFAEPSASEIGEIRINARTLATDDDRRNSAIGRFILRSEEDEYEFIAFVPTSLSGLPETIVVGDTLTFQVTGDLTVTGTTQEVTFDVTARLESADVISGTAQTIIQYADFGLTIPYVPSVTGVSDDVILTLNFVSNRVSESTTGA